MKSFKAGTYITQDGYKSFQPNPINRQWMLDNMEVLEMLGRADRELGRLDMFSGYVPNIDLFISMHVIKEATQSSRIEGTQTNIREALLDKEDLPPESRDDWDEVQNYIRALHTAIADLQTLPFSSRLIRNTHKVLLKGVRGKHKSPGEFRKSQNWIGGSTLKNAVFIPPIHSFVGELMSDLEKFIHNESIYFPELLRIALVHYQFETIHPFLDGNGRVGRLLITLYLVSRGILKNPVLYLSDFFEHNRSQYYDKLTQARENDDISGWFKFFLSGIIETAQNGIKTFDNILRLQKSVETSLQTLGSRAANAQKVMQSLYKKPITNAAKVTEVAGISNASAYKLIASLEKLGILNETTGGKRGRTYEFTNYLKLFSE
ncbi:MAG: Fic family protein [Lentimicrobium sp.]|jgi:Fic family protein|nr:Fic family protein [Lentimicrobium sp.]